MGVTIDLNYNCNNDCVFCFNHYDKTRVYKVADAKQAIDQAKKVGGEFLDFYGGEPFLYKNDLLEVLAYAHHLGFKSSIATNATLFDQKLVEELNHLGVVSLRTTLHGPNKVLHDLITQRPGSFKHTLEGIKSLLTSFKGQIIVNVVVTKLNYKFLKQIVNLLEELDPAKKLEFKFSNLVFNGQTEIYKKLALPYNKVQPWLNQIVVYLKEQERRFFIEKFPYCLALNYAANFVQEQDLDLKNISWANYCESCAYKSKGCVGYNNNYLKYIQPLANEAEILTKFEYGSLK